MEGNSSLKREATKYVRYHGFDLITALNESSTWYYDSLKKEVTKHDYIISKLIDMGILTPSNNQYLFRNEEKHRFLSVVNSKKIEVPTITFKEKELENFEGYLSFLSLLYEDEVYTKAEFLVDCISLSLLYLEKVKVWEDLNLPLGGLIWYIKGIEYLKQVESDDLKKVIKLHFKEWKVKDIYHELSKIDEKIKIYNNFKTNERYFSLRNHFRKCFNPKCNVCGGNLINTMIKNIEQVRQRFIKETFVVNELNSIKKIAYCTNFETFKSHYEKIKKITESFSKNGVKGFIEVKNLEWEKRFNKKLRNKFLPTIIEYYLYHNFYWFLRRLYMNKLHLFEVSKEQKRNNLSYFVKEFRDAADHLLHLKNPATFLDSIDREIIQKIAYDKKIFKVYDKTIKKLGKTAEKWIYEGLKEKYKSQVNITVRWMNEEGKGTGTLHPYDLVIYENDNIKEYIEVKTTHSEDRTFSMSKKEYEFAMKNEDQYKIYLIVNMGTASNTYYEIIDNVAEYLKNKRLKIISQKLALE